MNIFEIIAKDKELQRFIGEAFKWAGNPKMVAQMMEHARARLWSHYHIDIEIYT